jgi:ElaB/YqjD/DUF883 family membrane-anchored ribosome-binding protein
MASGTPDVVDIIEENDRDLIRPAGARAGGNKASGSGGLAMAADVLKAVADGARGLADQLKDPSTSGAADALRKTGDSLDKASDDLRERDVDEIMAQGRDYVRENPAIVVGAAAVAGLIIGRMLKSGR